MTGAPDRPLPQRLQFGSGGGTDFPFPGQAGAGIADQMAEAASESGGALPSPETIADLKPLGQVNSSFIVAVNGEGLWIIDQHVAHERVLFEEHGAVRGGRAGARNGRADASDRGS